MKLHMLSSHKLKQLLLATLFMVGSSLMLFSSLFSNTANAAMTANDCYAYNGTNKPASEPNEATEKKKRECIDRGYCKLVEAKHANITCNEEIYKASEQYVVASILTSEAGPVANVICDFSAATGIGGIDQAEAECRTKVATQYQTCRNNVPIRATEDGTQAEYISSCLQEWAKTNYPSADLKKIGKAVVQGIDAGIKTADEVAAQKSAEEQEKQAVCEAKNMTYSPDAEGADTDGCVPSATTPVCTGGSLGWILCPIATLFQNLIDIVAGAISDLMEISPIGGNSDLLRIWTLFVGFANLLLVIAFLIVIFSQATSFGLSAYGIKKMLPRIIAAAILINLSYFICTLALDITNVIGKSIGGIINAVPVDVESGATAFTPGATWASNLSALALGGVGVYMLVTGWVAFIVPVLIAGGLAVLSMLLIIALRQVLVILLVLAAPLAFVAMILPNTEPLFTKWRKLFVNMLVMYPVVMFLLYGSGLVGQLIQATNSGQGDDSSAMLSQMVAFVVMTIGPFAGMYMYLKSSNKLMSMATGVIGKLGGGLKGRSDDWAKRKRANNRFEQNRQAKINATNEARQRTNLVRMGRKERAPRGLSADAQRLWQTNIDEANNKINEREIAGHASYLTRPASIALSQGHRIDKAGNIVDSAGTTVTSSADVDQRTKDAMRYAERYNLLDSDNGRKAVMSNLYKSGGMDTARLHNLVQGNTASGVAAGRDASSLVNYSNELASQNNMTHLMFNTTDGAGQIEWGGALPLHPTSTSKAHNTRAATDKLADKGVGAISKDVWSDSAVQADLVASVLDYKASNPASYARSLSKADGEQIKKMHQALLAQGQNAVANGLVAEYNAAVSLYK